MPLNDNQTGYGPPGQPPMAPEALAAQLDSLQGISAPLDADGPHTEDELAQLRARLDND